MARSYYRGAVGRRGGESAFLPIAKRLHQSGIVFRKVGQRPESFRSHIGRGLFPARASEMPRLTADKSEQPISIEYAARLIYQTAHPDPKQVGGVRALLLRGELRRCSRRRLATSRAAVAEYLAASSLRRQEGSRAVIGHAAARQAGRRLPQSATEPASEGASNDRYLRRVYRDVLGDYFRSVVFARSTRKNSQTFRRAVLGLQVAILAFGLGIAVWTAWSVWRPGSAEPAWLAAGAARVRRNHSHEKRVVQAWLGENRTAAELLDILPAHRRPGGRALRIRFRFRRRDEGNFLADNVFVVRGREVLRIEDPDPADEALVSESP